MLIPYLETRCEEVEFPFLMGSALLAVVEDSMA